MKNDYTKEIIELTRETIFDALMEEQQSNPLFFKGDLTQVSATLVNNNLRLNFRPNVLAPAMDSQFIGKLGLLFYELKRHMLDEEAGAWLEATIHIDGKNNSYYYTFNYEDSTPDLEQYSFDDYQLEFFTYPRTSDFVPSWVQEKQREEIPPSA